MRGTTASRATLAGLVLALLVGVGGCGDPPTPSPFTAATTQDAADLREVSGGLEKFRDCAEFVAHMRSAALARIDKDGLHLNEGADLVELTSDTAGAVFGPAAGPGFAATSSTSGPHFPTPPGAESAATDGRVLVTARLGSLEVVDVSAHEPRLLGHLDLDDVGGRGRYVVLAGTRVLVLGPADDPRLGYSSARGGRYVPERRTTMSVVDLSDPARPRVVSSQSVTGRFVAVRGTGDLARVVIVTDPETRPAGAYRTDSADARAAVAAAPAADWLPDRQIHDENGKVTRGSLLDCAAIRYPPTDAGLDVVSVLTVDLAGERPFEAFGATGVLGSGDLVAASAERLVVGTTAGWPDQNRRGNRKLAAADPRTLLHTFDLTSSGTPRYVTTGGLAAYVAGQGALSVRGTDVRVVTSAFAPWYAPRNSTKRREDAGVAVLVERAGALQLAGAVANLAGGRPLKVIRWTDDVVALAPMPEGEESFFPNPNAGRTDLVHLPAAGGPRLLGGLALPTPTAKLFGVGGGFLVGTGLRAGMGNIQTSLEVAAVSLDTANQRGDALSYGQGDIAYGGATWLPRTRLLVLVGSIGGRRGCPGGIRCVEPSENAGAVVVRVGDDGALHPVGQLEPSVEGRTPDILELGDRLAVVGDQLTLLNAENLRATASVELPYRGQ